MTARPSEPAPTSPVSSWTPGDRPVPAIFKGEASEQRAFGMLAFAFGVLLASGFFTGHPLIASLGAPLVPLGAFVFIGTAKVTRRRTWVLGHVPPFERSGLMTCIAHDAVGRPGMQYVERHMDLDEPLVAGGAPVRLCFTTWEGGFEAMERRRVTVALQLNVDNDEVIVTTPWGLAIANTRPVPSADIEAS